MRNTRPHTSTASGNDLDIRVRIVIASDRNGRVQFGDVSSTLRRRQATVRHPCASRSSAGERRRRRGNGESSQKHRRAGRDSHDCDNSEIETKAREIAVCVFTGSEGIGRVVFGQLDCSFALYILHPFLVWNQTTRKHPANKPRIYCNFCTDFRR